jgi:DNA-binding CsgD family transcriptional regulator
MITASRPFDRDVLKLRGRDGETATLDRLVVDVQAGESRTLVLSGEAGVGKTALLEYLVGRASGWRVKHAAGIQSEMELPFAALHQLLGSMIDQLSRLPGPQRAALETAFGISSGPPPNGFLVGLAVLGLLAEVAEERPLLCVVDDEQWLDRVSAQVLVFVARRLGTEGIGMVFAAREPSTDLAELPQLVVEGLGEDDARGLLDSMLSWPLDERVRDQLVSETGGNPLALLELVARSTPAALAGGFGLPARVPVAGRIEQSFRRRLDELPDKTRRLLQLAAADPVGEPSLVWRAATRLAIPTEAATPAIDAGLIDFGARVRFRHPLVRSAAYRSASVQERHDVHRALAAATDPDIDPDRRAWHSAQAAPSPDEHVAAELERSADRAHARGGLAAAAAFHERSAMLTPEPIRRAQRLLAAAKAKCDAGSLEESLGMLVAVEAGPHDARRTAEVEHLRGQIASQQRRGSDAAQLLLGAACRLEPLDVAAARETHLEALGAAMWASPESHDTLEAARAARAAPPGPSPPRVVDVLLDGFALWFTDGYAVAAPSLSRALKRFLALDVGSDQVGRWLWLAGSRAIGIIALELWDADSAHTLATRQVQVARENGAVLHLQFAVNLLARTHLLAGELTAATMLMDEDRLISEATGNPPVAFTEMSLVAWRGQEAHASELIEATLHDASALGLGRLVDYAIHARTVLYNGLGRYEEARDSAQPVFERDQVGYGPFIIPELAEAASRTGDKALLNRALGWLETRTRVTPNDWLLGIRARVEAMLSDGDAAETLYRESIQRLAATRVRVELARGHLLYGEWLRRERRRVDSREQLRSAHEMFASMGVGAFAERARRELLATGETARRRTVETRDELTAQETQIAILARDGHSNPEIATRLFISPRTVQYHLHKVFTKLEIGSRTELERVLPIEQTSVSPV